MTHWQKSKAYRIDIAELAVGNELIRESAIKGLIIITTMTMKSLLTSL